MEKILLSFFQMRNKSLSQKELSEYLEISQRQLSRNLDRWKSEGIIEYNSGNGRGNKTSVTWCVDIEK